MDVLTSLTLKMIDFDGGNAHRIQHFTKVHAYARLIGLCEGLDAHTLFIIEAAALVHDIGIRPATEKYGRCTGRMQEEIGPAFAEKMLKELGVGDADTERICFLVAHHHTYEGVDGVDWRILLEADFLVNLQEGQSVNDAVENALQSIFRTETGTRICRTMFGI